MHSFLDLDYDLEVLFVSRVEKTTQIIVESGYNHVPTLSFFYITF